MSLSLDTDRFDYILVGGGLQSGLIAMALAHHAPESRVLLIERGERLGGNHTWSFHPGDVPPACRAWILPLIQHRWPAYDVKIGDFQRRVELQYASIASTHFATSIENRFAARSTRRHRSHRSASELSSVGDLSWDRTEAQVTVVAAEVDHWMLATSTDVIEVGEHSVRTRCGKAVLRTTGDRLSRPRALRRNSSAVSATRSSMALN